MAHTIIDIFNNILTYNDYKITVIIDDENIPWFSAIDIATILEYADQDHAIRDHVSIKDQRRLMVLRRFMKEVPPNSQPYAIYINESGLYSLILASRMPKAEQFKKWVTEKVLPSIRKTGYYMVEKKYRKAIAKLNQEVEKIKLENKILKNNQSKIKYRRAGMIYIIRQIDAINKKLLKLGKTKNLNKRLNTYNTSVPDDMEVLFTLEVDNPDAVEMCVKGLANKHAYREKKEYYQLSLPKLKKVIESCNKLVDDEFYCEKCQSRVSSIDHFSQEYDLANDHDLYLGVIHYTEEQIGGGNEYINILACPEKHFDFKDGSDPSQVLVTIPISNAMTIDRYCQVKLTPTFDQSDKIFYKSTLDELKKILTRGKQEFDESLLNQLDPNLTYILDISYNQSGETKMPSEEFVSKSILMEGGGCIHPTGLIIFPDGKLVRPDDNPPDYKSELMRLSELKEYETNHSMHKQRKNLHKMASLNA